jgi:hypothetical protein
MVQVKRKVFGKSFSVAGVIKTKKKIFNNIKFQVVKNINYLIFNGKIYIDRVCQF